jgi:hypothetical protein
MEHSFAVWVMKISQVYTAVVCVSFLEGLVFFAEIWWVKIHS